ncbi:hypothetical protein BBBOND_0203870 [Babesia bigemina]|uniref:Uncharacterized protein n=1 Tax=Babesia bigemina TaxID=5866 RepID=A0A061D8I9_BABBI|nr:hypothetical protein BBBOND_0203870 [Babesia bigemina]CDR95229.1 hypothetical protein BBBOND_0203870 [Babesia bigemina]|eukprot:XP_012767415.1 hypothetical protein BBBOND_0203870 [Babesia bigemina]
MASTVKQPVAVRVTPIENVSHLYKDATAPQFVANDTDFQIEFADLEGRTVLQEPSRKVVMCYVDRTTTAPPPAPPQPTPSVNVTLQQPQAPPQLVVQPAAITIASVQRTSRRCVTLLLSIFMILFVCAAIAFAARSKLMKD